MWAVVTFGNNTSPNLKT